MLFGAATGLAAFLLLAVQPMLAKVLLPYFGGGPMVWATCLALYQFLLLLGYTYVFFLTRLSVSRQARLHLTVLIAGLLAMTALTLRSGSPVYPSAEAIGRAAAADSLVISLARTILTSVGLPFVLLSATSPLLQLWHTSLPSLRGSPYRLYAVSNGGSLAGLVAYPVMLEPLLRLPTQVAVWSAGWAAFALALSACIWVVVRGAPASSPQVSPKGAAAVRLEDLLVWIGLAAGGSALLVSATNQMSGHLASVPFVWLPPLAVYLGSFIWCFSGARGTAGAGWATLTVAAAYGAWWAMEKDTSLPLACQMAAHLAMVGAGTMLWHGELYRRRPPPAALSGFYLAVALGGALGGMSVSLLAPHVFSGYWEYPVAIGLAVVMAGRCLLPALRQGAPVWLVPLGASIALVVGLLYGQARAQTKDEVFRARNFFGVLSVKEQRINPGTVVRSLMHGRTCHGIQFSSGPHHHRPSSYFGEHSGVGLALRHHPRREEGLYIGALGLGVGTLCAYAQPQDRIRFYEIDPQVVALARDSGLFDYISQCRGHVDVVVGDARRSLEQELRTSSPRRFDVMVVDVFTGGAIPVHFLTREAFSLYLAHLRRDGILAFHVSNMFLDLPAVLHALAELLGLRCARVVSRGDGVLTAQTEWVLLSRNAAFMDHPEVRAASLTDKPRRRRVPVWTDDYASLLPVLRRAVGPPRSP